MGLCEFKDTPVPSPCRSLSQTYFIFILVPISPPSPCQLHEDMTVSVLTTTAESSELKTEPGSKQVSVTMY